MVVHKLLFILCVCFAASVVNSNAQLPVFRNYGTRDGMPSSETYCIMQDSRGYMFIGTDRGLVRFDGTNFETLTTGDGLVDNTIFLLAEDHGKLWYYTFSGNLGYLYKNKLFAYPFNDRLPLTPFYSAGASFSFDKDGSLLLNRYSQWKYSISVIDEEGKTCPPYPTPENTKWRNVYLTASGRCITSGAEEAANINVFTQDKVLLGTLSIGNKISVNDFAYVVDSKVWLGVNGSVYLLRGKTFKKVLDIGKDVLYLYVDKQANIWVGYRQKGLVLYRQSDKYKQPMQLLPTYSISCIKQDREGGMWFTTLENGIYYLPPDFPFSIDEKSKLPIGKTLRILRQNNRPLLFQSDNTLLTMNKNNSWSPVFPGRTIFSAGTSADDKVYFTSKMNWVVPKKPNSFIRVYSNRILCAGSTIITTSDYRILCFDKAGNHIREDTFPKVSRFTCAAEARDNIYLTGALRGLYIYRNDSMVPISRDSTDFLCRISGIEILDDQHVAVATHGNGIMIIDRDKYTVTGRITRADGLKGTVVNALCRENDSVLWVGTNGGLGRISYPTDKRKMVLNWADMDDGILSNEINDICRIDSQLWLATAKGITLFPLNKKLVYDDSIPVLLNSIMVNGNIWSNTDRVLTYNQNNISVSFIGINYHYGRDLKYCYRLKGKEDTAWNYTSTPTINYISLSPGSYVFEYAALAPNEKSISHFNSFFFTIMPPFWLRWWFLLLMVVIFSVLLFVIIQVRFKSVKKRMQLVSDLNMYRDKALRNQMSPHFVYNSLNLLGNFVMKLDDKTAMNILTKFSSLMRLTFKNTGEKLVTIEKDLEALKLYSEMESMRFPGRFDIDIPSSVPDELKHCLVPPLLIQPFVENAILHGLLPKKQGGLLSVSVTRQSDAIRIIIKDNGIGRQAASEIKKRKDNHRAVDHENSKDSGITVTTVRIKQVWEKSPEKSHFKIVDLHNADGIATGTFVEFYLPLMR